MTPTAVQTPPTALTRAAAQKGTPVTDYELTTIRCTNREAIRFKGKLIAEQEWETRHQSTMRFEIWETAGGALIGVIDGDIPGEDKAEVSACIALSGDEFEQRIEIMRFFDFHDRARSMVRRQLRWKLVREVA